MHEFVVIFENVAPKLGNVPDAGLGGGNVGIARKTDVKLFLSEVDILEIRGVVDQKRHGQNENAQFLALLLRNTAVAVCNDSCFSHKNSFRCGVAPLHHNPSSYCAEVSYTMITE